MGKKRIFYSFSGIFIMAISVGLLRVAAFGVDPLQSLLISLEFICNIRYGTLYLLVNGVLLLFGLLFGKCYVGITTIANLTCLGYLADFTYGLLLHLSAEPAAATRILFMLLGILLLCMGNALCTVTNLGVGPYDTLALVLAEKWHVFQFKYCRISTDLTFVLLGIVILLFCIGFLPTLGKSVGVATAFIALFTGPFVQFFCRRFRPFIYRNAEIG